MAQVEDISIIEIPPPLPPKNDLPLLPPKDISRITFATGVALSPSQTKGLNPRVISDSESHNSSYTFSGAKGAKRPRVSPSLPPPPPSPLNTFSLQSNEDIADQDKGKSAPREMLAKLSLWLSLSKFKKPKDDPASSEMATNDSTDIVSEATDIPRLKKTTSISKLFRRISTRRRKEVINEGDPLPEVRHPTTTSTSNFSTISPRRKNFNTFLDKFTNRKASDQVLGTKGEASNSKVGSSPWDITGINRGETQLQKLFVEGLDFSISSQTLFQDDESLSPSSTQNSTTATTMESIFYGNDHEYINDNSDYFGINIDSIASFRDSIVPIRDSIVPIRDSMAKSSVYSTERADDDTIKGVSGTIRSHSRVFDGNTALFLRDDSNQRLTIVGRPVSNQVNPMNTSQPKIEKSFKEVSSIEISKLKNNQNQQSLPLNTPSRSESLTFNKKVLVNNAINNRLNLDNRKSSLSLLDPKFSNISTTPMPITPTIRIESDKRVTILDSETDVHTIHKTNPTDPVTSPETIGPSKSDKSPLKFFTKRLYQSLRPSNSMTDEKRQKHISMNINGINELTTGTLLDIKKSPKLDERMFDGVSSQVDLLKGLEEESEVDSDDISKDVDNITFDDGVEGDVSATQSQAQDSSLYTPSEYESSSNNKPLSRMSSFARSYNSEDPSAMSTTFSDSQIAESEVLKTDWPVETALINFADFDKGPARLSNNHLAYIPNNFFDELHSLKALYLDRNSLRDLPEELLKLTKLEILDLSNNCIAEFHPRLKFKRLRNMRRLNLDNNGLIDITSITKLKTLRELRVNNNFLDNLTPDIGRLVKLKHLHLSNNDLSSLPETICRLRCLTVLRLNNNHIRNLPSSFCSLRQLQVLEIRGNLLSQLPENLKDLENLTELDISQNNLGLLPNDITRCTKLVKLDVHSNQLESIPLKIGQLSRLVNLNLQNNRLSTLPADIGKLTALTDLDLSKNQLIVLPEELGKLVKLTEIKLNDNPSLLTLPPTLKKLTSVKKVHLQNCSLSQIPFDIGLAYKKLTLLDISCNSLDTIPKLDSMEKLWILKISNNRINDLTDQIDQLSNLRELYASGNKLKQLPRSIGRLKNLEILDIAQNLLMGIPLAIGQCQALKEIRLSGNHSLGNIPATLGRLSVLNIFHVGEWPDSGFTVTQEDSRTTHNTKTNPYQQKVPQSVERALLWRMHDSILKRLRELDNNDGASDSVLSGESLNVSQQDFTASHPPSPIPPRDDVILKMAVLKGVYDQIIRDVRNLESDKESSGDEATEFPGDSGKKKKFMKLKDFKFLNRGDK
ncbi:hypothetical protein G9A89_021598 [Geosiphon pyriformis]|nr:hypothetical protein G9A89_021598 [Geosiphon pyriformis]